MLPLKNSRSIFFALLIIFTTLVQACNPERQSATASSQGNINTAESGNVSSSSSEGSKAPDVPYNEKNAIETTELTEGVTIYYIAKGSGPVPSFESNVLVNYHGMLEDGTVFDSSFERGQPMDSPLNRLIRGWQLALTQVPVGSRVKLVIPPELGYGPNGSGNIPPNATLIFDIELISMY